MVAHPPETPHERAARLRRNDNAGRPARITDLRTALARIVETGPYPKE